MTMNKRIIFLTVAAAAILATGFKVTKDLCNAVEMKKKTMPHMTPFNYDSAKLTRITLTKKPVKQETEVPLSLRKVPPGVQHLADAEKDRYQCL